MFGQGYTPVESVQLEDGVYDVRIVRVGNVKRNNFDIREVEVQYREHPNAKPNILSFFERPLDAEKAKAWDLRMTKFFDAFNIQRGNFEIPAWHGKVGKVQVVTNKKDPRYKDLYPYAERGQPQVPSTPAQQAPQYQDEAPIPDAIW